MFATHKDASTRTISPEVFARKLRKGRNEGISVIGTSEGDTFTTSRSRPGLIHNTTHAGCSCEDFFYRGSCCHHTILIATIVANMEVE